MTLTRLFSLRRSWARYCVLAGISLSVSFSGLAVLAEHPAGWEVAGANAGAIRRLDTETEAAPVGRLTTVSDDDVTLVSCYQCGHAANQCACGPQGDCSFTNLFWCNPYGDVVLDPCDRNACADCGFSEAPLFYATAELVPMARDQQDDLAYATLGAGGPVVLETGDFKTEFDAGARVLVGATLADRYRLEGSYLGGYEWSDRAAVRNLDDNGQGGFGNLFSPFSNFGTPAAFLGVDFNDFAQIEMTSKFDSAELNLRRRLIIPRQPWPDSRVHCVATSWSLGIRYLNLDESFGYLTNSSLPAGGSVNRANVTTANDLIGAQLGMLSQFLVRGQGWVDFEVKGGIYHNEAEMTTFYQNTDGGGNLLTEFAGTDARDRTSFLGELSLVYNHQLTRRLSCRVGYNAFWLTGVALASHNLNTDINLLALGPPQLKHDGDMVLHGPTLGLTYAY